MSKENRIMIALAALGIIVALMAWLFPTSQSQNTQHESAASPLIPSDSAQKLGFRIEVTKESLQQNIYKITVPNGGMYDTGIWVQSPRVQNGIVTISAWSEDRPSIQPFVMKIGNKEFESHISLDGDAFNANCWLVPAEGKVTGKDFMYLPEAQKICLMAGKGAVGGSISLVLDISK